jgi:hypothetical protein
LKGTHPETCHLDPSSNVTVISGSTNEAPITSATIIFR